MKIAIKKINQKAHLPQMMRDGDAAFDLSSIEDVIIEAGKSAAVATGIAMAIPTDYWGNIRDRSGMAAKHAIHTMGGVVDSNYRGEIKVVIINLGSEDYHIREGDRIAQMIISKHENPELIEMDELDETERGQAGFNSSGY